MESGGKRLLVVEDEDAIRALLFAVFRRRGFQVDTARNGLEALDRCDRCRYSVVLLDLMMPRMNGYEFLERLAERPPADRPIVIVLTAGGQSRNFNTELVAGTMKKPFDIELLADTVAACIQTSADVLQPSGCPPAESESDVLRLQRRDDPN